MPTDTMLFLSDEQLADLTGYARPSAQVRWLQRNGVTHYVRADGRPRVPVTAIIAPLAGASPATPASAGPNLDAVRRPR
jgi:hypothetical protein